MSPATPHVTHSALGCARHEQPRAQSLAQQGLLSGCGPGSNARKHRREVRSQTGPRPHGHQLSEVSGNDSRSAFPLRPTFTTSSTCLGSRRGEPRRLLLSTETRLLYAPFPEHSGQWLCRGSSEACAPTGSSLGGQPHSMTRQKARAHSEPPGLLPGGVVRADRTRPGKDGG